MTPSARPRSPVEPARAAGMRWQAADQEFVRHQRVCRFWKAGRFCRACERLEIRTNLTSREYARALRNAPAGAPVAATRSGNEIARR